MNYWLFQVMYDMYPESWKMMIELQIAAQHYPLSRDWTGAKRNNNALSQLKKGDAIIASFKDHRFAGYGILKSNFYIGGPSIGIIHKYTKEIMEFYERFNCDWTVIPLNNDRPYIRGDDAKEQGYDINMIRGQCVKQISQDSFNALKFRLDNSGAVKVSLASKKNIDVNNTEYPKETERDKLQYWLWVTRPEYYDSVGSFGGWSCHKDTKKGDLVFLWRAKGKSDISHLLQVVSDPAPDPEWGYSCDYKNLHFFKNPVNIKDLRSDSYFIEWPPLKRNFQSRAFRIEGRYWGRLNQIALDKNPDYNEVISYKPSIETIVNEDLDSLDIEERYNEGGKYQRYVNYYERNRGLNIAARRIHGTKCMVCGFDFKNMYGDRGSGYIEVHHLIPVSSLKEKTEVDPMTEMAVVCSNCHRMIHRKKDNVLSLEELKILLKEQNSQDHPNSRDDS